MAYPYQNGYNPYYPQQYNSYPAQQQGGPICRLVSSREEATGTPVDFMGNLMVFADVQNNRIYTKRWNAQAGASEFGEFRTRAKGTGSPGERADGVRPVAAHPASDSAAD